MGGEIMAIKICENGMIRDATAEEIAALEQMAAETPAHELTPEERLAELEAQNQVLTQCLLEMSQIVYA